MPMRTQRRAMGTDFQLELSPAARIGQVELDSMTQHSRPPQDREDLCIVNVFTRVLPRSRRPVHL